MWNREGNIPDSQELIHGVGGKNSGRPSICLLLQSRTPGRINRQLKRRWCSQTRHNQPPSSARGQETRSGERYHAAQRRNSTSTIAHLSCKHQSCPSAHTFRPQGAVPAMKSNPHLFRTTQGQSRRRSPQGTAAAALHTSSDQSENLPRGATLSLVPHLPPLGTSAYCSPPASYGCKHGSRICSAPPPRCEEGDPAEGDRFRQVCGGEGAGRELCERLVPQGPCGGTWRLPEHLVEALGSPQSLAAASTRRPLRPSQSDFLKSSRFANLKPGLGPLNIRFVTTKIHTTRIVANNQATRREDRGSKLFDVIFLHF